MDKNEEMLIELMEIVHDSEAAASLLSLYVQKYGPLSKECGEKVRKLLEVRNA